MLRHVTKGVASDLVELLYAVRPCVPLRHTTTQRRGVGLRARAPAARAREVEDRSPFRVLIGHYVRSFVPR